MKTLERLLDLKEIRAEKAARAQESLRSFVRQSWHVVEPATPYIDGWHVHALCEHLEAVTRGDIKLLLINMPPRHMKSLLVSAMWPMWEWTTKPYTRWMFSSYALSLAIRDSLKCRRLIESEWYQSNWGHVFTMAKDQNLKSRFENDKRGYRLAVSVGSAATGEGGDRIVCDDPHNVVDAESQTIREGTLDWWDTTMSSRINNPKTGAKIIVMQRVHADDLSGHVLEQGGYVHLKLPAEYEPTTKCFTAIGWEDPRTDEGELLWPDRFSQESLDGIKRSLGSLGYAGQYQQSPTPSGGAIFKKQWIRYFTETPDAYILQKTNGATSILKSACWRFTVVDLAISSKQTADYTVIQTYDVTPHKDLILIDQIRDRMDNPEQLKTLKMVHARLRPMYLKVESIAYQLAIVQQLKQLAIPVREYRPTRDKVSRASVAAILMENEKFFFRQGDPYLLVLEPELLMFPLGAHDDQCVLPDTTLPYLPHDDIIHEYVSHHEGDKAMLAGEAQELEEGQFLLTHTGAWKKITKVFTRSYGGDVVSIKPQGGIELTLTPEHPVFCVKRTGQDQFFKPRAVGDPRWVPASEVAIGDCVLESIDQKVAPIEQIDLSTFLLAERFNTQGKRSNAGLHISRLIVDSDVIRFNNPRSHPIKRIIPVNKDFCRLLGYYVAEGSRGKHNVSWSFHMNEREYLDDVSSSLVSLFGTQPSAFTQRNATTLSVSSLVLHDFFSQFGRGAENKKIPQWVMHLPCDLQVEFLKGAWRGDGCVTNEKFVYMSSSQSLVIALRMMLYRLGIVPSITISRPNGMSGQEICGKKVGYAHPLYCLHVGGEYASQFAKLVEEDDPRVHIKNGRIADRIVDGYVHRRVRKVELQEYEGPVFNFEVEDDHSYQTESFLVHNCDDLSAAGDEVGMPHPTGGVYIPTVADLVGDDGESMALLEDERW